MLDPGVYDNPVERFQTMSITSAGGATIGNRSKILPQRPMNVTADIPGAQPSRKATPVNRPELFTTQDISGAAPRTLHRDSHKPQYMNRNDDIDGSQPHPYTFKTNRHVNPMEPVYTLPQDNVRAITPPRLMRETNVIHDIDGTAPSKYLKYQQRDTMKLNDIEGASAGWKPRHRRRQQPSQDRMDVTDINNKQGGTRRVTDPLDPVHTIHGMTIAGEKKMHPKPLPSSKNAPFYSLTTHDIEGARAGWKPKHEMGGIAEEQRRHFRNINYVADIQGSAAGSKVNGLRTKRVTDPNNPMYPLLDGAVYDAPVTPVPETRQLANPMEDKMLTLSRQVDELKKELEIAKLTAEINKYKSSKPGTSASRRSQGSRGGASRGGASRGGASRGGASRGGASAGPAEATPGTASSEANRYVLRSADGRPRVSDSRAGGASARPPSHGRFRTDVAPAMASSPAGAPSARQSLRSSASRGSRGGAPPVPPMQRTASAGSWGGGGGGASFRSGGASFRSGGDAGGFNDNASVASYASMASVASVQRSVHTAYSNYSRASARSRAAAAAARTRASRGATPGQRRQQAEVQADLSAVMALPDRPPSALSQAGSNSFR